jgi:hypothetical protein
MKKIKSRSGLQDAIQELEINKAYKGRQLKEQACLTLALFRPGTLLKNTLSELASTPDLMDTVLSTAIGLGTGYISKKIVTGNSGNIFRKFLGSVLQLGITTVISQHPKAVKSLGRYIIQHTVNKNSGILKVSDR